MCAGTAGKQQPGGDWLRLQVSRQGKRAEDERLSRKRSVRNNSCQQHAACLRSRCLSECRSRQPGSAPGPGSGVDRELTVRPGRGVERKSKQRLSHTGLSAGPVGLRNKEQTAPGEALVRFWRTRVRFPPPPRRGVREPSSRHAAGRQRAARRSRAGRVPPSLAALPRVIVRWRSRRKQSCTTGSSGPPGTARAGSNRSASRCASPSPPCTVTSLSSTAHGRRDAGLCPGLPETKGGSGG